MSAITEKEEEDESHNYHQKKEQAFNIWIN